MSDKRKESLDASASKALSFTDKVLHKFEIIVYSINSIMHDVSKVLLLFMMLLISGDVIGRYFFNFSIAGAHEMTGLALAVLVFFSLGSTQLANDHISIDFLMSKCHWRLREIINVIFNIIILILLFFTSFQLFRSSIRAFQGNEQTGDLGLPIYLFQIFGGIGVIIFALPFALLLMKTFIKEVEKNES
ncbi:TRAP transporter small permease [Salibacterium aidingense]|uniref:TRAP transporter small permease n=1 Tax=Salibacterium aidingense TaxID=384933 RepID=UPI003BC1FE1F